MISTGGTRLLCCLCVRCLVIEKEAAMVMTKQSRRGRSSLNELRCVSAVVLLLAVANQVCAFEKVVERYFF